MLVKRNHLVHTLYFLIVRPQNMKLESDYHKFLENYTV